MSSVLALFLFSSSIHAFLLGSNFGIPTVNRTFDYIIVGGSNAGLTIASRLTEDPKLSVAVVEAGSFYEITTGNTSQVPALEAVYWNGKDPKDSNPLVDWGFVTTPQAGINGQKIHYERGKTLGGCTALNYMAYERTTNGALQQWAELVNDSSYTPENFGQYYAKSTNFTPPNNAVRSKNSTPIYDATTFGNRGPLNVGFSNYAQAISSWFAKGMADAGICPTNGFTNGRLNGSSWTISTLSHTTGQRDSSETSFMRAALGRPGFTVYVNSLAERIMFNGTRATGVLVNSAGAVYQLSAMKELILTAGAFQSPQLLMVSGVGPSDQLAQHGISVVSSLAGVGQGMNDHIYYGPNYRVSVQTATALEYGDNLYTANDEFNERQNGLLSNTGGDFVAYERFPASLRSNFSRATQQALDSYPSDWPDLEYLVIPAYTGDQQWPGMGGPRDGYQYATLAVGYMKPLSRGNVTLQSASMADPPLINPNWLTDSRDQEQAIAAFKRARQIFQTPTMMKGVNIGPEYYPGASVSSDAQILEQIQRSFNTIFHATSTCKMGPADDQMAVVDSKGRVFGTQDLRVADASVLPFLPAGLPMGTVYALAEKIADEIQGKCASAP